MDENLRYDPRIWAEYEAATMYAAPCMRQKEREERTYALYRSCFRDGEWAVSILDAGLVTAGAVYNALIGSRYAEAIDVCRRFFDHPDLAQAEGDKRATIQSLLGAALILNGEIEPGLAALSDVSRSGASRRTQRAEIRAAFRGTLEGLGKGRALDGSLRDFAVRFLEEEATTRRRARKALRAKTCGALQWLLER